MRTDHFPPDLRRSEAFAEDLDGLVSNAPQAMTPRTLRRLASWLPLGVALAGLAAALVPPLL
jgi:hypothetical protein